MFNRSTSLRSITIDGSPWFVGADICKALDLPNVANVMRRLDPDELTLYQMNGQRGLPVNIVSESGLYSIVMRSTKPAAKPFRKWVTGTVLPSIRKDGLYVAGQEKPISDDLTLDELMAQITTINAKVAAINEAKFLAYAKHQEEKQAGRTALKWLSRKPGRKTSGRFES